MNHPSKEERAFTRTVVGAGGGLDPVEEHLVEARQALLGAVQPLVAVQLFSFVRRGMGAGKQQGIKSDIKTGDQPAGYASVSSYQHPPHPSIHLEDRTMLLYSTASGMTPAPRISSITRRAADMSRA